MIVSEARISSMIQMRISQLLRARGQSLYWLAHETGINYSTLWKQKKGESQGVSFVVLRRVCDALDCAPGDLLVKVDGKKSDRKKRA